jgi:hypothetical protein
MRRLGYALLAGVVADNPPMAVSDEDQEPNAGWAAASAENPLLYGHPLSEGDSYLIQTGVLACVTTGTLLRARTCRASSRRSSSHGRCSSPPTENSPRRPMSHLHSRRSRRSPPARPRLVPHRAQQRGGSIARRTGRRGPLSIRDPHRRWRRDEAPREGLRCIVGEVKPRRRLTTMCFGARGPVPLTPNEWWMTRLCALRNAIVHGNRVPDELWEHEGHSQLNHMPDRLISTLRIVAANEVGDDPAAHPSARAHIRSGRQRGGGLPARGTCTGWRFRRRRAGMHGGIRSRLTSVPAAAAVKQTQTAVVARSAFPSETLAAGSEPSPAFTLLRNFPPARQEPR